MGAGDVAQAARGLAVVKAQELAECLAEESGEAKYSGAVAQVVVVMIEVI